MRRGLVVVCLLGAWACGDDDGSADAGGVDAPGFDVAIDTGEMLECGDPRVRPLVYYGTPEPEVIPLTPGQVQAIGTWGGCSGAFVTQDWVLTANHCRVRLGDVFRVGVGPTDANIAFRAEEVHSHPSQDMTLVRMDATLTSRLSSATPVAINTETLMGRIGEIAEASGYGTQEDGSSGEREFTAEPIAGFEREFVVIDGEGRHGVCFGDSGGPLFVLASDGSVRVAGDLSFGDPSCVGLDRYSRTDLAVEWIEGYTGPTIVEGAGCGTVTGTGRCLEGMALYCVDDELQVDDCDTCGWDESAGGFRCISGEDPCGGFDSVGACDGDVARWCEGGVVSARDCAACDLSCGDVDGLIDCREDPCGGLDYLGRCDGDIAEWCDDGELRSRNCGAMGLRCEYIDDRIGYFCTR